MQVAPFSPAYDTGEILPLTFDYGPALSTGITITSVQAMACVVVRGSDPLASTRLSGSPTIIASPNTGGAAQAVLQLVGGMLGNVTYQLQALVNTSDGQRLSLRSDLPCLPVPT